MVVLVDPGAALLVLPVGGDSLLGDAVHVVGADLHLEGVAVLREDRGVQRLVAVRAGHGDEVLDPPRDRAPGVVQDAERRVAVGHAVDQDPEGHEVVDLLEVDLLALELLLDRVEALDAPLDPGLDPGRAQLLRHRGPDLLHEGGGALAPLRDPRGEGFVARGVVVAEGEVLELVLDLGHPEPPRDRGVDVERLARDALLPVFRQVLQRPHVVEPVGELDQDHPDVVDHGEEHLPVRLGLALLGGGEGDLRDLGDTLHDVEDVGTEVLQEALGGGEGVLEDVVQQAHRHADGVHPHLGQDRGHLEGVHEVGLARGADLALVLDRREDVRLAEDLEVGVGVVALDRLLDVLEADHGLGTSLGTTEGRVK